MRSILALVVLVALIGGGIFLVTLDIPPPTREVEIIVPDDRLPQ